MIASRSCSCLSVVEHGRALRLSALAKRARVHRVGARELLELVFNENTPPSVEHPGLDKQAT